MSAVEQIFQGSIQGAIDPVFAYVRAGRLDCPPGVDPLAAWRHLSGQVARDALDVEAHVRRVLLACQPPLTERAFGALVDLFLALGDRGRGLRRQLLDQAEPWLDPQDAHLLRVHLDSGLPRGTRLPAQDWSLFDSAVLGASAMVELQRREVARETPFQQAMSLLEYGDLEGARGMLEEALLDAPQTTRSCASCWRSIATAATTPRRPRWPSGWSRATVRCLRAGSETPLARRLQIHDRFPTTLSL